MATPESFLKNPKAACNNKKRRIMRAFKINEISPVDMPAQEWATAALLKRRTTDKRVEKVILLTSVEDGHQHSVSIDLETLERGGGYTSYDGKEPTDSGVHTQHEHTFIINQDGTITVAMSYSHTHTLDASELLMRLRLQAALGEEMDKSQHKPSAADLIKIEEGKEFLASDFAFVPDPTAPNTWKYRLVRTSGANPDRRLVGNAVTAIKMGSIPKDDQATVIRRVRTAWTKSHVGKSYTEMPSVLKQCAVNHKTSKF